MSVIFSILIIALVLVLAFWVIDQMAMPYPLNWIFKLVVGILGLAALLKYLPVSVL